MPPIPAWGEIEKDIQEAAYAERIGVTNGVWEST